MDFSVLIPRKAFVEALGLDFCPAALSQGLCYGSIQSHPKPQWFGAGRAMKAGGMWQWEAAAADDFQGFVTAVSTLLAGWYLLCRQNRGGWQTPVDTV